MREFFAWPGQRSFQGWWWSMTTGTLLAFESLLERQALMAWDFEGPGLVVGGVAEPGDRERGLDSAGPSTLAAPGEDLVCSDQVNPAEENMHDDARRFRSLDAGRCQELLAEHTVGRIAWQAADGPLVLPVTYVCHDGSLVFRTSPYGVISELVRPTDVALQVDGIDESHRSGWSVLVQGRAEAVAEPADVVHLWTVDGLVPWAPGVRNLFIRITPRRITGRLLTRRSADVDPPERWTRA